MTTLLQCGLGGRGAEGRHSSGGATSPPWRSAFNLPITELGVVRHGPDRQRWWDCFQFEVCLGYRERNSPPKTNRQLSPLSSQIFGEYLLQMLRGRRAGGQSIDKVTPLPSTTLSRVSQHSGTRQHLVETSYNVRLPETHRAPI